MSRPTRTGPTPSPKPRRSSASGPRERCGRLAMLGRSNWLRKGLALVSLACAGVSAGASTPVERGWTANPEEQFLLDVSLRQLRLGDGVRAYNTPEGTCVLF